jgi:hypothetical protein
VFALRFSMREFDVFGPRFEETSSGLDLDLDPEPVDAESSSGFGLMAIKFPTMVLSAVKAGEFSIVNGA